MHNIKTRTMRVRSTAHGEFFKACIALNETISKGHNRVELSEVAQSCNWWNTWNSFCTLVTGY